MKKILILQNEIMQYRKPVYNELSKYYEVTVLHSGKKSIVIEDKYKEIIADVKQLGPLYLQSGVLGKVRSNQYDIVIAMFDVRWIMNVLALWFHGTAKFLYWGHRYGKNNLINNFRNYLMKKSDGIILYSGGEIDRMIQSGLYEDKIFIAENTIDVPNHEDGSNKEKSSFLFVGRAQKRKKIDELLRAFSQIKDRLPSDLYINIIGDGDENEYLKKLVIELGINNKVFFHGAITDSEKLKVFFHKSYAYVSPGAVGLGVLHSLAYGVPVITYKDEYHGPEFDNLRNQENSLIVNNFEELIKALTVITDEKNYITLGNNAYKLYSEQRTIQYMINGFIKAIEG